METYPEIRKCTITYTTMGEPRDFDLFPNHATCNVCASEIPLGMLMGHLQCNHVFCAICISRIAFPGDVEDAIPSPRCPDCRQEFNSEDVKKIYTTTVIDGRIYNNQKAYLRKELPDDWDKFSTDYPPSFMKLELQNGQFVYTTQLPEPYEGNVLFLTDHEAQGNIMIQIVNDAKYRANPTDDRKSGNVLYVWIRRSSTVKDLGRAIKRVKHRYDLGFIFTQEGCWLLDGEGRPCDWFSSLNGCGIEHGSRVLSLLEF